MARPLKEGMDYFPHDTDASGDEKIEALRSLYGNDGYAFYFILLERIYRSSSFELDISDPDTIQILAAKVAVSPEMFMKILHTALKVGCFDRQAYEQHKVLTSNGIKKRSHFVQAKRLKMRNSYHGGKKGVFAAETTPETGVSAAETGSETTQSKVKKRKENESKENQKIYGLDPDLKNGAKPPTSQTKGKSKNNTKDKKTNYREYVRMTPEEYKRLQKRYGPDQTEIMLDILDNYKGSNGRSYKDDYRAILSWVVARYQEDLKKGVYHGQTSNYASECYPTGGSDLREFIQNYEPEPGDDEMH